MVICFKKISNCQKYFFLTVVTSFFMTIQAYSQYQIDFKLKDSININISELDSNDLFTSGYGIRFIGDFLVVFVLKKNVIFQINLKSKKKGVINLEYRNKAFSVHRLYLSEEIIIAQNYDKENRFVHYSWGGEVLKATKIKLFWKKIRIGTPFSFEYDEVNDLYYLPIERTGYRFSSLKKCKKYYQREGLIGVFSNKGKLIRKIGSYSPLYHDCMRWYSDKYSFILNSNNKIILSQELEPEISIIGSQSKKNIKIKENFITKLAADLPRVNYDCNREEYNTAIIESYYYFAPRQLNDSIYIRKYVPSFIDTTTLTSTYDASLVKTNRSNQCLAPSVKEKNQMTIMKNKPKYMQIFNLKTGHVYYDGPSKIYGYLHDQYDNFQKGFIWTIKLTRDSITLYKYLVITSKNE